MPTSFLKDYLNLKNMEKVKCVEIEIAIMEKFDFTQNLIVPNVTEISSLVSFETDMLILSKSGYAHGIEIKVSRQDLLNDFKKVHYKKFESFDSRSKTGLESNYKTLKYFSYAVPDYLEEVAKEVIPEFCGLYVYKDPSNGIGKKRLYESIKPQMIHSYKWSDKERYCLARLGTMRIYSLKKYKS